MQEFSTVDTRHEFAVDGVTYYLPGITAADFEVVADLGDLDLPQMVSGFRDVMLERAQPRRRSFSAWLRREKPVAKAVSSLNIEQTADLFKQWSGLSKSLGESLASPVLSQETDQS